MKNEKEFIEKDHQVIDQLIQKLELLINKNEKDIKNHLLTLKENFQEHFNFEEERIIKADFENTRQHLDSHKTLIALLDTALTEVQNFNQAEFITNILEPIQKWNELHKTNFDNF